MKDVYSRSYRFCFIQVIVRGPCRCPQQRIMDVPEILERFVPSFDTLFLGVKETEAEALTQFGHPLGWLLRVLQKEHSDETEISEALADAMSHIASVDEDFAPQIAEALRYFVQLIFHRRSLEERDALVDIIRQHIQYPKELETMAQTTAEFLIEQGEAKGKQDAVLKLLQFKFQNVPEVLSREISNIHKPNAPRHTLRTSHDRAKLRRNRYAFRLEELIKELETMAQTTAEFLIEQGIEQGQAKGKQDAVLKLLQFKFQDVPEVLSREIRNIHDLRHLDTLLEQAMTAQSLDEIDTYSDLKSN